MHGSRCSRGYKTQRLAQCPFRNCTSVPSTFHRAARRGHRLGRISAPATWSSRTPHDPAVHRERTARPLAQGINERGVGQRPELGRVRSTVRHTDVTCCPPVHCEGADETLAQGLTAPTAKDSQVNTLPRYGTRSTCRTRSNLPTFDHQESSWPVSRQRPRERQSPKYGLTSTICAVSDNYPVCDLEPDETSLSSSMFPTTPSGSSTW